MNVSECMSRDVRVASPNETLRDVARTMVEIDAGVLPVGENDRLVGMITDRDIAVRGVADGMGPETKVSEVMSSEVKYCYEDDDVDTVLRNMSDIQVRRLPVVNREKRLVGIISIGDLARRIAKVMDADAEFGSDADRYRPANSEVMRLVCDSSRLRAATGWAPRTSLEEGLAATVRWFHDRTDLAGYRPDRYTI